MNLNETLSSLRADFASDERNILADCTKQNVENLRLKYLGRKGVMVGLTEQLKTIPKEQKPQFGKEINILRQELETKMAELVSKSQEFEIQKSLDAPQLDISLPVTRTIGSLHPISLLKQDLLRVFRQMGFSACDGPELETEFYNFSALNIPDFHPARDMQDTFYVQSNLDKLLLRTHTSNVQIHTMKNNAPPLRVIAPGRVFRRDNDATHTPMFHQIEGFIVDRNTSFAHLKGVVGHFLKEIFGSSIKYRFRPSFFPFTEPSAEFDIQYSVKGQGWIEIGGCGMIHPNVFENVGIDSAEWHGFAFGFGMDRMAMVRHGIDDLRLLFEGDASFLSQFPVISHHQTFKTSSTELSQ